MCSVSIKTLGRCCWRHALVFIVNLEHISYLFLVFVFLALIIYSYRGKAGFSNLIESRKKKANWRWEIFTAWKVSVFGVFLVRMRENTDQKNSKYGHFSCSDCPYLPSPAPYRSSLWMCSIKKAVLKYLQKSSCVGNSFW